MLSDGCVQMATASPVLGPGIMQINGRPVFPIAFRLKLGVKQGLMSLDFSVLEAAPVTLMTIKAQIQKSPHQLSWEGRVRAVNGKVSTRDREGSESQGRI